MAQRAAVGNARKTAAVRMYSNRFISIYSFVEAKVHEFRAVLLLAVTGANSIKQETPFHLILSVDREFLK
jgi:hypothetical protein